MWRWPWEPSYLPLRSKNLPATKNLAAEIWNDFNFHPLQRHSIRCRRQEAFGSFVVGVDRRLLRRPDVGVAESRCHRSEDRRRHLEVLRQDGGDVRRRVQERDDDTAGELQLQLSSCQDLFAHSDRIKLASLQACFTSSPNLIYLGNLKNQQCGTSIRDLVKDAPLNDR